jgi:hypothetical protein
MPRTVITHDVVDMERWLNARRAVRGDPAIAGAMAPVLALLAGPFDATVVQVG